jgi:hypothetical protein
MARFEKHNPAVHKIFDQLEAFLDFCVEYGYAYNPSALNDQNNFAWRQFSKYARGGVCRNMWAEDAQRYANALNSWK